MLASSSWRLARVDTAALLQQELKALLVSHKPKRVSSRSLVAPGSGRREPYPRSSVAAVVPEGWEGRAKGWVDTHVKPFRKPEISDQFPYELYFKCLMTAPFIAHVASTAANERAAASIREQLLLPAPVAPLGMETMQMTALSLSWYSGDVPCGSSLKELAPHGALLQLYEEWGLRDILLLRHGSTTASPQEIVSCTVSLVGSMAYSEGIDVAGNFLVEKVFPTVRKMKPSEPPVVF